MAYYAFQYRVFQLETANNLCNKLVESIIQEFTVGEANTKFLFTGCAARHFQVSAFFSSVKCIAFITSSVSMYEYLAQNIGSIIGIQSSITYADRIQVRTQEGFALEIWLAASALTAVDYHGIKMQTTATIPAYFGSCMAGDPGPFVDESPLALNASQVFNPGGSVLYQQDWSFTPVIVSKIWTVGTAELPDANVAVAMKNYFLNSPAYYSAYRVELVSNRGQGTGLIADFFAGTIDGGVIYDLAGAPLNVTAVIDFINFGLLSAGNYSSTLDFKVTALDSRVGGTRVLVETKSLNIQLAVIDTNTATTTPKSLAFVHTLGHPLPPSQDILVKVNGSYTVTLSKVFSITAPGITDESTANFTIKRAVDAKTFSVSLNSTVETLGSGFHKLTMTIKHSSGQLVVPIDISTAPTDEIRISPLKFDFEAIIGVREAEPKNINVVSPLAYTYTKPDWLNIFGDFDDNFIGVVRPKESSNFAPGLYEGEIVFTSDAGDVHIPVTYKVLANSFTDLVPNKINFTRDQIYINLATNNTGVYLGVTMDITYYDFLGNISYTQYPLHVPIFNGKASFHPGTIVDRLMSDLNSIDLFIPTDLQSRVEIPFHYYRPAELSVLMEQTKYSNDAVIKTDELNSILFLKGTRPINYDDDCGIMFSKFPIRVTRKSYGMLNFVKRSGVHAIEIHVNGEKEKTITHDTVQDSLFGMVLDFTDYEEGDLIYVKLEDGHGGYYQRIFYVFPENKESYHIAWVTEHGQLELWEFTGSYSIESDYDRIENDVYRNLVKIKEILETDKSQPLKTNTGWVLRDNHVLLDSLMRAKKAWLFLPNTDYKIELVPQGKKMSNFDTERALYSYDVEFLINPDNDAKIYPR